MAHLHSVYDTDTHFKINDVTRKITDVSNSKTVIMQYDHNSERLTFEMPRYVDGHDMKDCNVVQVHYINVSNNKANRSEGVYEVEDFQISPEDENIVICSWLISQNATQYVGSLNFILRFVCSSDGKVDYAWNTAIYTDIVVSDGMYNGDIIVEEYIDVLEQWRRELFRSIDLDTTLSVEGMAADAKAVGDALAGININLGDLKKRIEALEQGSGGTDHTNTAILDYSRLDEMILQ